jgi:hypothetical protein
MKISFLSIVIVSVITIVVGIIGLMFGAWLGGNNLLGFSNYEKSGLLFGIIGLILGGFLGWKIAAKM